jgi:hypothetical protein
MRTSTSRGSPRRVTRTVAAIIVGIAAPGLAAAQESPFHTETCPIPPNVRGYPVSVRGAEGAYAMALAEAAARRWEVPSRRRASIQGLGQVRNRIVPPEPRWADDWFPRAQHVARLAVTLHRDGREPTVATERQSGDRAFDRSLETIFGRSPNDHPLPPFPASLAADSLRVIVTLGEEPADSAATVRFAAQQTAVESVRNAERARITRQGGRATSTRIAVTVKFDVDVNGRPSNLQVLRAIPSEFGEAMGDAVLRSSYTAAQSNCRPIAMTVVQEIGT